MAIYRNEETDKVNLFESRVKGILFRKFGTRIIIQVDWLEGYGRFNIVCNDCRHIDINFYDRSTVDYRLLLHKKR